MYQTVILLFLLCCVLKVLIHKSFLWNEWTTSFIDQVRTDCPGYIIAKSNILIGSCKEKMNAGLYLSKRELIKAKVKPDLEWPKSKPIDILLVII